jgi:hypothetical protein
MAVAASMTAGLRFITSKIRTSLTSLPPDPARFAMAVGGITLAIRDGWGLYWSMWGLVTTMGYALIYLWLVMLGHRSSRQVHSKAYRL